MSEMPFEFTRYFILKGAETSYRITVTFDDIKIEQFPFLELPLPANRFATVVTNEELQKFVAKSSAIIYGKFKDDETPTFDTIKSFVELVEMFEYEITAIDWITNSLK